MSCWCSGKQKTKSVAFTSQKTNILFTALSNRWQFLSPRQLNGGSQTSLPNIPYHTHDKYYRGVMIQVFCDITLCTAINQYELQDVPFYYSKFCISSNFRPLQLIQMNQLLKDSFSLFQCNSSTPHKNQRLLLSHWLCMAWSSMNYGRNAAHFVIQFSQQRIVPLAICC